MRHVLCVLVPLLAAAPLAAQTYDGRLDRDDRTIESGEFVDTYPVEARAGERLDLALTSGDFDPYVIVAAPSGEQEDNDDCTPGDLGRACVTLTARETGIYRVLVTSYRPGETGRYALTVSTGGATGVVQTTRSAPPRAATPRPDAPPRAAAPARQPARRGIDETVRGDLDASDDRLASGEFREVHTFEGTAGEPVRITMTSAAFDTYLIVTAPSGDQLDNDDADGDQRRSVVEFVMPESGRYRVTATSYRAGETGPYELRVSQDDAMRPEPPAFDRIVGVFVGISDYDRPGLPDLRWTAQDAVVVRDAMIAAGMRPEDGILLTDAEATVEAVERAFDRVAREADARTMFVFFYSGHGGQYPTRTAQRQDPDGQDESIELFDAPILDDAFDRMLGQIPSVQQLIVLDACFSGGFSKDVITQPGRMGLFSSEEDVVSAVAVRFEAGGFLSQFFADAVVRRAADADGNGALTPLELSQYLRDRYTSDIPSEGGAMAVARDTRPEHQHLVVDRGSVGLYDTLFLLP